MNGNVLFNQTSPKFYFNVVNIKITFTHPESLVNMKTAWAEVALSPCREEEGTKDTPQLTRQPLLFQKRF